ncbi:hypothetical protein [Aeromonas rivipollensis]|uniref:hypothetical protein n=1 Tax=Aeromonas rivipollensis TaxID=948519 RepID=UPI003D21E917
MKYRWEMAELKEQWWALGRCEFGSENVRSGGLMENCETLDLLQNRALKAINNTYDNIGEVPKWRRELSRLTPERARWCEASLCVQLAELAPDMKTSHEDIWRTGHKTKPGRKTGESTDHINDWLCDIVHRYERFIESEESIGLSIILHENESVYPSEIVKAAELLTKVKENQEKEKAQNAKALLISIEEARAKLADFHINTSKLDDAEESWIKLLAHVWDLLPNQIYSVARKMKGKVKGHE